MIYCDSSFLIALYHPGDAFHAQAGRVAAQFRDPIPYTLLAELEVTNALWRGLGIRLINPADHAAITRQLIADESAGILERTALNQVTHYGKARELSKTHTAATASRALDILHVAAALVLGAHGFASFDHRQRTLAQATGLGVFPKVIPRS